MVLIDGCFDNNTKTYQRIRYNVGVSVMFFDCPSIVGAMVCILQPLSSENIGSIKFYVA